MGFGMPASWPATIACAGAGLCVLLAYSPVADRIATRFVAKPPTLDAFRGLQESKLKLLIGIVIAWILGGFIEETLARGVVLKRVEIALSVGLSGAAASALAVLVAALFAAVFHFYQGLRAVIIVGQLSVLFGVLYVVSDHNLWAVILCHGMYDTVAFVRFANKNSKYSTD